MSQELHEQHQATDTEARLEDLIDHIVVAGTPCNPAYGCDDVTHGVLCPRRWL